jgi:hypothetical protein
LASAQKKVCLTDCNLLLAKYLVTAIAYHKQLHVLKQTVVAPKQVHLVAIDLVKASLISMPERFNSICTNGKPLTKSDIKTVLVTAF